MTTRVRLANYVLPVIIQVTRLQLRAPVLDALSVIPGILPVVRGSFLKVRIDILKKCGMFWMKSGL